MLRAGQLIRHRLLISPHPIPSPSAASQEVAELGIESVVGRPLLYQAHASTLAPSLQGKGTYVRPRWPMAADPLAVWCGVHAAGRL